jgi:hypothetical protein
MGDWIFGAFGVFGIVFAVLFAAAMGFIIFVMVMMVRQFVRVGRQQAANDAAPEVQAQVRVIGKRVETLGVDSSALPSKHTMAVRMGDDTVYQRNLVAFEQAGGERFELEVPSAHYGLIAEGDTGVVTMKGTEFVGFGRQIMR